MAGHAISSFVVPRSEAIQLGIKLDRFVAALLAMTI